MNPSDGNVVAVGERNSSSSSVSSDVIVTRADRFAGGESRFVLDAPSDCMSDNGLDSRDGLRWRASFIRPFDLSHI